MAMPLPSTYAACFRVVEAFQRSAHVSHYILSALACMQELAILHREIELADALRVLRLGIAADPGLGGGLAVVPDVEN